MIKEIKIENSLEISKKAKNQQKGDDDIGIPIKKRKFNTQNKQKNVKSKSFTKRSKIFFQEKIVVFWGGLFIYRIDFVFGI